MANTHGASQSPTVQAKSRADSTAGAGAAMNENVREQKAALRRRVRNELKRFSPSDRLAASTQACSRLQQEQIWREAQIVLLYAPLSSELDVEALLRDALATGKTLTLPRFDPEGQCYVACQVLDLTDDLRPGRFGLVQPRENCLEVPLKRLDFILAPGVAFTLDGRRLRSEERRVGK